MKHTVSLCGSYSGGSAEHLFKKLPHKGILQLSLVGREITLQVMGDNLDEIKNSLKKLGVENIDILHWSKTDVTLSGSGRGKHKDGLITVSLIPSGADDGIRELAFLSESKLGKKDEDEIKCAIEKVLVDAGITNALYSVSVKEGKKSKNYSNAARLAAINAIFESGGIVATEQK